MTAGRDSPKRIGRQSSRKTTPGRGRRRRSLGRRGVAVVVVGARVVPLVIVVVVDS